MKPFNWSLLDRDILAQCLNGLRSKVVDKKLRVEELHDIMSRYLKRRLPIRISKDVHKDTKSGYVYIGAWYHSDRDRRRQKAIEMVFSYSPNDTYITLSQYKWSRMCLLFADTMLHEIIHMRQFRARDFKWIDGYQSSAAKAKDRMEQNYYGDKDEIGAYAFNIACELYDRFGSDRRAINYYLDSNDYKRHKRTCFYKYMKAFGHNHNHRVIKTIKRKSKFYLPYAEFGKPYKTSEWLTE